MAPLIFLLLAAAAAADVGCHGGPCPLEKRPRSVALRPGRAYSGVAREPASARSALKLQGGSSGVLAKLKMPLAFTCWYLFSIVYSIVNKQVLSAWNFPCTSAAAQLLIGVLTIFTLWAPVPVPGRASPLQLRAPPVLSLADLKRLSPVALCLASGHLLSTVAPAYGTVAFTNVVKTAEPLFTCAFSALFLGQTFSLPVYLSLIPVILGVCLATASEVSFSMVSLVSGLLSNVAFAMRAITAKQLMQGGEIGSNLTSQNLYGVLTAMALAMCVPVAALVEGPQIVAGTRATLLAVGRTKFLKQMLLLGTSHYFYNECAFLALSSVHPVSHAVANTVKRIAVIIISLLFFRNPLTLPGAAGSAIAIGGVFLYSLAKARS